MCGCSNPAPGGGMKTLSQCEHGAWEGCLERIPLGNVNDLIAAMQQSRIPLTQAIAQQIWSNLFPNLRMPNANEFAAAVRLLERGQIMPSQFRGAVTAQAPAPVQLNPYHGTRNGLWTMQYESASPNPLPVGGGEGGGPICDGKLTWECLDIGSQERPYWWCGWVCRNGGQSGGKATATRVSVTPLPGQRLIPLVSGMGFGARSNVSACNGQAVDIGGTLVCPQALRNREIRRLGSVTLVK